MNGFCLTSAAAIGVSLTWFPCHQATAADLPPHSQLRILIVSDFVNPWGLPPDELSGPGDLSVALLNPAAGINLDPAEDGLVEIPTNDIHLATAAISVLPDDPAAYDVIIYFAHRMPNDDSASQNAADQAAFVAAADIFLQNGGGFVSFHHGFFPGNGKVEMMSTIIGGQGSSIAYNTVEGQNVINVAPNHFVTTHSIEYGDVVTYADAALGIPEDAYPFFNNVPDERYRNTSILADSETIEILFASNYIDGGSTHLLGFTHQEPGWLGKVVVYQPGEYQPNALDDLDGNNFQILANEIVFSTGALLACPQDIDQDGTTGILDFLNLLAAWGPCAGYCPQDIDGDGMIGITDFLALLGAWGPCL